MLCHLKRGDTLNPLMRFAIDDAGFITWLDVLADPMRLADVAVEPADAI